MQSLLLGGSPFSNIIIIENLFGNILVELLFLLVCPLRCVLICWKTIQKKNAPKMAAMVKVLFAWKLSVLMSLYSNLNYGRTTFFSLYLCWTSRGNGWNTLTVKYQEHFERFILSIKVFDNIPTINKKWQLPSPIPQKKKWKLVIIENWSYFLQYLLIKITQWTICFIRCHDLVQWHTKGKKQKWCQSKANAIELKSEQK